MNNLDDMALVCECGCVSFNYLKSNKLECESCEKQTIPSEIEALRVDLAMMGVKYQELEMKIKEKLT